MPSHNFEKIKPIILHSDFVIANLETPITDFVFIDASHLL